MKTIIIAVAIFIGGMLTLGATNAFFSYTNEMDFCTSCHTMRWNLEEYKETVHYKNASGVRATCSDCHVPSDFLPKVGAKIVAVADIYHQLAGTIDTKEQFVERRWELANRVWDRMRSTNSRECRKCHDFDQMDLSGQSRMARKRHGRAPEDGETCIDCHQGIAHEQPEVPLDDLNLDDIQL